MLERGLAVVWQSTAKADIHTTYEMFILFELSKME